MSYYNYLLYYYILEVTIRLVNIIIIIAFSIGDTEAVLVQDLFSIGNTVLVFRLPLENCIQCNYFSSSKIKQYLYFYLRTKVILSFNKYEK